MMGEEMGAWSMCSLPFLRKESEVEGLREETVQLPSPSSLLLLSPPQAHSQTLRTGERGGTWQVLCLQGPSDTVSVIKIITAGVYRGRAMCQASCQESLTRSRLPPPGGQCIIFIPT